MKVIVAQERLGDGGDFVGSVFDGMDAPVASQASAIPSSLALCVGDRKPFLGVLKPLV